MAPFIVDLASSPIISTGAQPVSDLAVDNIRDDIALEAAIDVASLKRVCETLKAVCRSSKETWSFVEYLLMVDAAKSIHLVER